MLQKICRAFIRFLRRIWGDQPVGWSTLLPGLLLTAIKGQDNNLVQALVIIYAVISILGLLFGDILMAILDPRISFAKKEGAR